MEIQVWSDVVCPWCYIGKKRLERALDGFPHEVRVIFRAYQLDPSPVPQPVPTKQVMAEKFGGTERAEQMFAHVAGIAAADGLKLDFDRAVAANTFDAHRLIAWASERNRQLDMVEALQRAHFTDGVDIGSHEALDEIARSLGLEGAAAYLNTSAGGASVRADLTLAREYGISSVPTFVLDHRYAVQGAQEPAVLRSALDRCFT